MIKSLAEQYGLSEEDYIKWFSGGQYAGTALVLPLQTLEGEYSPKAFLQDKRCQYCGRRDTYKTDVCEGCGAPL